MSNNLTKRIVSLARGFDCSLEPPFPKKNLLIELSNICNHRCIFCANKKMQRKKGYMSFDFLQKIMKEAYKNGTREIGFYATGEPLIYPQITDAIKLAKNIGYIYTYITTNGALLNKEKAEEIVNAGIDSIKFSINAGSKETYELIHGKDEFDIVINNLKNLYNYREECGAKFKIYVSFVVTKFTLNEIENFKSNISKYCEDIVFVAVGNQAGMSSEMKNLLTIDSRSNDNILPCVFKLPCYRLFDGLTVTCEGYMSACCVDFENQLIVGNLNEISLKEAWCSDKFKELRKMHIEKNVSNTMCQNCMSYSNKPFEPISECYATPIDFEKLYDSSHVKKRIEEYIK